MESTTIKVIAAIFCITIIEVVAICKGKNGFILRMVIAAIALLAGVSISQLFHH